MKKLILGLVAVLSLSVAAITPALADTKIGVIDLQNLLPQIPEMTQASANLNKAFSDREKEIITAQANLSKDADNYSRNTAVMSAKDKQAAEQKLRQQQQNIIQLQDKFKADYTKAQNEAINKVMTSLKAVVQKVAAKDNLNLVLISAGVAYSDPGLDVTKEVLEAWQNKT